MPGKGPLGAIAIALAMLVAGCFGDGAAPAGGDGSGGIGADRFEDGTGAVDGLVMDDEGTPIPGAMVAILGLDRQTVADEGGRFTFPNVPEGRHAVAAQKLGYGSAVQSVQVVEAQVATVHLVLAPIRLHEPYSETWADRGYFECSWSIFIARGPCFFPGPQPNFPNNRRQFDYEVDEGVMTVMVEMSWTQATAATGDAMSMFLSHVDRPTTHWYCLVDSPSPVELRWDRGDLDASSGVCRGGSTGGSPQLIPLEGQALTARANVGRSHLVPTVTGFGFGLALQQSFDVYFSNFYWEAAPEGYSGIPDR